MTVKELENSVFSTSNNGTRSIKHPRCAKLRLSEIVTSKSKAKQNNANKTEK
jgi:hypothetical protein